MYINLLPNEIRGKIQFRAIVRNWAKLWVFIGAWMIVSVSWEIVALRAARERAATLTAQCQPVCALQDETQEQRRRVLALNAERTMLERLQPTDHLIDLLGVLSRAVQPGAGKLQVQRFSLLMPPRTPPSPSPGINRPTNDAIKASPSQNLASLSLQGVASDDSNVAQFVSALRHTAVFEQVDLKSSTQLSGSDLASRTYQIECRIEEQP